MLQKKLLVLICSLATVHSIRALTPVSGVSASDLWVKNQLAKLSTRQKIGQLMMLAVATTQREAQIFAGADGNVRQWVLDARKKEIKQLINEYGVGGIICFRGSPSSQIELLTDLQQMSQQDLEADETGKLKLPLLVGQDAEWGLAMRLQGVPNFPKNMTLGAIQDKSLLETFGRFVGIMCRAVGVHINFAPVVDCNTNPRNPVIGIRSFGEDPEMVFQNAWHVINGMILENIVPCIKHFPGHGDTSKDSHKDLPKIDQNRTQLDIVALSPFKRLAKAFGRRIAIMTGHIAVPAITKSKTLPASLSPVAIKQVIRQDHGFGGLVITDALNMKAITKFYSPAKAALAAFMAGNDILLFVEDVQGASQLIHELVAQNSVYAAQLDASVERILRVKYKILEQERVVPMQVNPGIFSTDPHILELKQKLYEEAITIVRNDKYILPLDLSEHKIGYIKIGGEKASLAAVSEEYEDLIVGFVGLHESVAELRWHLDRMRDCDALIVALGKVHVNQSAYGDVPIISPLVRDCVDLVFKGAKPAVLSVLTSPYALKHFAQVPACVEAYEDQVDAELGALKVILGDLQATGKLPIKI